MMTMRLRLIMLSLTILTATVASGKRRAVAGPDFSRILVVTAHPDDESVIAPLLGTPCIDGTSRCSFLVMTRGERGGDPVVREGEMRAAAALFHATLTLG